MDYTVLRIFSLQIDDLIATTAAEGLPNIFTVVLGAHLKSQVKYIFKVFEFAPKVG